MPRGDPNDQQDKYLLEYFGDQYPLAMEGEDLDEVRTLTKYLTCFLALTPKTIEEDNYKIQEYIKDNQPETRRHGLITSKISTHPKHFRILYETGEAQIMLLLGPNRYRNIPILNEIPEEETNCGIPSDYNKDEFFMLHKTRLLAFRSKKHPMIRTRYSKKRVLVAIQYTIVPGPYQTWDFDLRTHTCVIEGFPNGPFAIDIYDPWGKVFNTFNDDRKKLLAMQKLVKTKEVTIGEVCLRLGAFPEGSV